MTHRLLAVAALAGLLASVAAAGPRSEQPRVSVELLADVEALAPGAPFTLALRFHIERDWHLYWKNPGDSGLAPKLRWRVPPGFEVSEVLWPAPKLIRLKHLANHGFEDELILLADATAPASLRPGEKVTLACSASWLVCRENCIPGEARLELELPVEALRRADAGALQALTAARFQLPLPAEQAGWTARARLESDAVHVELRPLGSAPIPAAAELFPEVNGWLHAAGRQEVLVQSGRLHLRTPRRADPDREPPGRLAAVLTSPDGWRGRGSERGLAIDAEWSDELPPFAELRAESEGGPGVLLAALLAFAGGLLLNLMPCVLPVVSLKVLSFARAARDGPQAAVRHALSFAAGVITTFWAVAAILLVLRGLGARLGWGFQLQSPILVAVLAALFTLLALNLFGVFEIGVPLAGSGGAIGGRRDLAGAFGSGVLATVVATPCTAPFMGGAVGAALVGPWWLAVVVFTALGAGMASPYVLLAAFPPLLARVPKPGRWMETLRQALGFVLLGTAVWLAWVFGRLTTASGEPVGVDGVASLLAGLVLVAGGAWLLGRFASPSASRWGRALARLAAAGTVALGLLLPLRAVTVESVGLDWKTWSPELVESLEAEGRPYFLDFTASWCLSCQVNEQVALDTAEVRDAFDRHGITAVQADWTNRDERITKALAVHGRASVPVYLLHPGAGSTAELLPNILTEDLVLDAVETAMRQAR